MQHHTELFLRTIFDEAKDFEIIILRNYSTLPHKVAGSDIDLCLEKKHINKFIEIVLNSASKFDFILLAKYRKTFDINHLKFIHKDENNFKNAIRFDVMHSVGVKFLKIFDYRDIKKYSVNNGLFYVPSKQMELAIILSYYIYSNISLKQHYVDDISQNVALHQEILQLLKLKSITQIHSKRSIFYQTVCNLITHPTSVLLSILSYIKISILRIFRINGLFIVILGPDGVGKSTITEKLKKESVKLFPSIKTEHLHPKLLPTLGSFKKKLFSKEVVIGDAELDKKIRYEKNFLTNKIISHIRLTYYLLDYFFGYLFKIYNLKIKDNLIIYDRYYYDYFYDEKQKNASVSILHYNKLRLLLPQPDIIFFLNADPETILQRKKELTKKEIDSQNSLILSLATLDDKIQIIDANQNEKKILLNIKKKIIEHSREKYAKRN